MAHLTKYGKRMKLTLVSAMSAACMACVVAIPFVEKKILKNDVGYVSVTVNGEEFGAVNTQEEAQQAVTEARLRFSNDYSNVVYLDPDVEYKSEERIAADRMSVDELSQAVYSNLFSSMVDMNNQVAYTVRIDDFTVTLASKEEVVELLDRVASSQDTNNQFQVSLLDNGSTDNSFGVDVVKSEIKDTNRDIVAAAMNGGTITTTKDGSVTTDGITDISFKEDVQVSEVQKSTAKIINVNDAYNIITAKNEQTTGYVVQKGDTLTKIAQLNGTTVEKILELNVELDENSIIVPGDVIAVNTLESVINVVTVKTTTYEEDYSADVEYVDDNNNYKGVNTVVTEGTTGRRKVTAEVTYVDGVETNVEYTNEVIITPAQPTVIAVGTLTQPEYIRPIVSGSLSSYYGDRDGEFHKGVDWAVNQGTVVNAAAEGTVTRAGWYGGYGYCVDIAHDNGTMTRYGHLSEINVTVGQRVSQGQAIALSGNTGNSTGPHLHFEIWVNNGAVNPLDYVNKN